MNNEIKKSDSLIFTATKVTANFKISVKIRLNDECKNGHQDFSITAETYVKSTNGRFVFSTGGCIHEEILKHFPKFAPFVALHLCDFKGQPMHCTANGFYHLDKMNQAEYCKYYRINKNQYKKLVLSANELHFGLNLLELGILEQWKKEADKAILMLQELTGIQFVENSTRSNFYEFEARIAEAKKCQSAGEFEPRYIEAEKARKAAEVKQAQYDSIKADFDKVVNGANIEYQVKKHILNCGLSLDNFIFYNHSGNAVFNWLDYKGKISQAQFDEFLAIPFPENFPTVNFCLK